MNTVFPSLSHLTVPLYYGIDHNKFKYNHKSIQKVRNKFIYSSFPNRGLLELLTMWPKIVERLPDATLHIYADVNGKWVNEVEPAMMVKVRELLDRYKEGYGIHYYGWVSKQELAQAWLSSEYWLYPCTFMETFCLTALEAALSRTLVICNDLAALQNTVGDRGVVIRGDAKTQEWQTECLNNLFRIVGNNIEKNKLIEKNYKWATTLSWEGQSKKLITILTNKLDYYGVYNWTSDLPIGTRAQFEGILNYINNKKIPTPKVLEVGTYTGTSLVHIISKLNNSVGLAIDRWENYKEFPNMVNKQVEDVFYKNIVVAGLQSRIKAVKGDSNDIMIKLIKQGAKYDFIYVDGSHMCLDCYSDLVLAFELLNNGGVMGIDDYTFNIDTMLESPYEAINHFLNKYSNRIKVLEKGYRIFIERIN
jgi:predicted O-methyltransferase YrrM